MAVAVAGAAACRAAVTRCHGLARIHPGAHALRTLFSIAAIREAINRLLPVANIGGELVGVRLLSRGGVGGTTAAASVIIEMLLNVVAQYVFLTLGVAWLLHITGSVRASKRCRWRVAGSLPR